MTRVRFVSSSNCTIGKQGERERERREERGKSEEKEREEGVKKGRGRRVQSRQSEIQITLNEAFLALSLPSYHTNTSASTHSSMNQHQQRT